MQKCEVDKCPNTVSKPGYTLCFDHWKAEKNGDLFVCEECGKLMEKDLPLCSQCYAMNNEIPKGGAYKGGGTFSSTALGKKYGLSAIKVNQIFAELGWITKYTEGWIPTPAGKREGAQDREMRESGIPYVVWPKSIIDNKILIRCIKEFKGEVYDEPVLGKLEDGSATPGFREKFPCNLRATDGHMVRSKGEVLIDNFLYASKIVHAYERKLPIEEDIYCDFYLPENKVYIEYWGLEGDPKYMTRMEQKRDIYKKYTYNLIELTEDHVKNLDDFFPKMLLKFGIKTNE